MSIYLIRGGREETGFYLLPVYFNYRKNAVEYKRRALAANRRSEKLKIIKFVEASK